MSWETLDWGEKRGESCIGTKKISRENIGDDQTCVFSRVEHTSTTYNDQLLVSHRKKNLTTFYNVLQRFTTFPYVDFFVVGRKLKVGHALNFSV